MAKPTPTASSRRLPLRGGESYLARLRVQADLSLRDVEARTSLDRADISKIERGRLIPTSDELRRLLDCYAAVESERSKGQAIPG